VATWHRHGVSTQDSGGHRRRLASRRREAAEDLRESGTWRRETYRLPRDKARETAKEWFERYPKAAYLTKVESWRVTHDGLIEFTMRRLPTAD
jgi:hypothetical protein